MEIRIIEREQGRYKNVEVYTDQEFYDLLEEKLLLKLNEMTLWQRIFKKFKPVCIDFTNRILDCIFRQRLKENKNT